MKWLPSLICFFRGHRDQPYTRYSSIGVSGLVLCQRCGRRRWYG